MGLQIDRPPLLGELSAAEILRKVLHLGVGVLAFALVFLGPRGSVLLALGLLLFNVVVFPRLGSHKLWRREELERGGSHGIPFYPLALVLVALLCWNHSEVLAAVWGVLAFGDGMATLVGRALGGPALPWNARKTYLGSLAYILCGGFAAWVLLAWTLHHQGHALHLPFLLVVAVLGASISSFLESQPQGLDDNLLVPPLTALVFWALLLSEGFWSGGESSVLLRQAGIGLGANLLLAFLAWRVRSLDFSGALVGGLLGTVIWATLGWRGFLVMGAFFVLGSAATRIGAERKAQGKLAQEAAGQRSAKNALANAGVATAAAVFALTTPLSGVFTVAFAGAFAAAASDTVSSEIGQLSRGCPRLVTTLQAVPPGTDGAVSLLGTVAGLVASVGIAVLGWLLGLYPFGAMPIVALAGVCGNLVDSLLGATLERRGLLDNEGVNFLTTLAGALVAGWWLAHARG
jgi:uncharacterized protein (TIGR00297 family)